jgi:ABC-type nitrate/sulfonate/bicarbonate transport system substrate-binding protein
MASKGAIIFSALALALLRARSASPERIRIAYSAISGVQLPLWMAQEKGLFERNGFEVDGGEVQFARALAPGIVQASTAPTSS